MNSENEQSAKMSLAELITRAAELTAEGKSQAVKSLYNEWIEGNRLSPLKYVGYYNLGVVYASENDRERAMEMYEKALEQNPQLIQARLNLGTSLEQLGQKEEALEQWRQVLQLKEIGKPENKALHIHALNNLGRLLEEQRQFKPALEMLEKSLTLDTTQKDVMFHLTHLVQKLCRWPIYHPPKGVHKDDLVKGTSPLAMLAASDDPEQHLAVAKRFVKYKFSAPQISPLAPPAGYNHDRIRIGYLSSNLSMHAVSLLTVELFERHDRTGFEVYGFCWSNEDGTPFRQRVINGFDHFIRIGGMSDKEAAECIRLHEIDIIFDLQGLTSGARPLILSHRPAPLQVTYLGFPGTTGLPWIDYVIADRYLIPETEAQHYSEKPIYLPNCFQSSDSKRQVGPMPKRSDYSLPEDAFVYCSFNNNYKYTPEMFAVWMRILKRVTNGVLWLLADNEWAEENLIAAAKKHGIKQNRLIFAPRVTPADYLARYQLADLFLDTYPFNGGTTANDALFMGLPLLTLSGRTFAARMAGSLLTALGLPELIASSYEEYEKKAVQLANNAKEMKRIKNTLLENRGSSAVFDMERHTRDMEAALAQALATHLAAPPRAAVAPTPISGESAQLSGNTRKDNPAPFFSVIIATHERPKLLERSLASVKNQSFRDFEILVVSDSSDTETYQAAGKHLGERDIFIKRTGIPGPAASRNLAIDHATGQYLLFLDDDDSFAPDFLEKLHRECLKNREAVLFCNFHLIKEDRYTTPITQLSETFIDIGSRPRENIQLKNYIPNNVVAYPRLCLDGTRFDTHLRLNEDWDFLLNVLENYELRFVDICGPRVHKDDPLLLNRRGTKSQVYVVIDMIYLYRRWPAKTEEIRLQRQQLLEQAGTAVPIEWL